MAVEGYNIAFKIGGKTLAGRTQDDMTIAARVKESQTKDDAGATQVAIVGHDVTFRATGLVDVTNTSNTKVYRDTMLENSLKKGSAAILTFVYEADNGDSYTGSCIITNYAESSNSSDEATYTVDFRVTGAMTLVS